ncbi:MAG TPA: restriction endonuclease subunit S [Desulfuromonadales bacterium]|nr:restriction endonuclease subunit S [Desulfuromonadales bacterium]
MSKWSSDTLGNLCNLITDGKHGDCVNEDDSGYYFISAKDVNNGRVSYENARQIIESDFSETHRRTDLQPGDILLTNSGTIGRLAIVDDDEKTAKTTLQKSVAVLKPNKDRILSSFLYYSLAANTTQLINAAGGAAQKNLLLGDLRRLSVLAPSLAVQHDIASILSTYDDLIENNRRRMALLEEAARQLYQEWFVRLRFPGREHIRIVDGVPEGWEREKLGEHLTLNYGKALKADNRVDGPYPVYGSSGEVGTHEKALVPGPAIIVGRKGNVGSVYWSWKDCYPIDTVYYINAETSSLYLYYALKNMHFISTDVAVPGLNRDFAYSRELLLPTANILRLFHEIGTPIHEQLYKLEEMNQKLRAARDLLLPKLMSGEIAV